MLDNLKKYRSFLNGRPLSEGVRITTGIIIPAFVMAYFGNLSIGIAMSLGALSVSITDVPGPVRHRINGMGVCILLLFSISLLAGYAGYNIFLLGLLITVSGFVFSMLTVYGSRSSAIGIAVLVIMIISLNFSSGGREPWLNSLFISAGGLWYMVFSISLYHLRPYKMIQQELGDLIIDLSEYLKTRALFYVDNPDYDKIYRSLLQQQINIEAKKGLLRELIFKTRVVAKESNYIGRNLIKLFLESDELHEDIITTYQSYDKLHENFGETGILHDFRNAILYLCSELHDVGIALKSGAKSEASEEMQNSIKFARQQFETLRLEQMNSEVIESFIYLGRILRNLESLALKVNSLHRQTTYDKKVKVSNEELKSIETHFVKPSDIRVSLFKNNLNLKSNIFRHSIRVSLALLVAYVIGIFINLGHSSWILLTVLVILKPAYSLTKTRNRDRLLGTAIGLIIGALLIYFIHNNNVLLVCMILLMLGSYVFLKTHYFIAVIFLTAEVLILFNLLNPGSIATVLEERLLDTFIGSVIAFLFSLLVFPVWEVTNSRKNMYELLSNNLFFYKVVAKNFAGKTSDEIEINKARKEALISLSNLSDTFTKMLSEPKRYQQGIKSIHSFVVLNYILLSHISTLSQYLNTRAASVRTINILPLIENTENHLGAGSDCLLGKNNVKFPDENEIEIKDEYYTALLEKRKSEVKAGLLETPTKNEFSAIKVVTDQFEYIQKLAVSLSKICKEIKY